MAATDDHSLASFRRRNRELEERKASLKQITDQIRRLQTELDALNRRQQRRRAR